jgi:hypothetical protein
MAQDKAARARIKKMQEYIQMEYHLSYNLYPPQPRALAPAAMRAVYWLNRGMGAHMVRFPRGCTVNGAHTMRASAISEWLNLYSFVRTQEE